MNKVTMDQVVKYIMYIANEKDIAVNAVNLTSTLYLTCHSLIKEGRLKSSNFYNFSYSGYLSTTYIREHRLSGIDDYRLFCEARNIPELEDKYLSILSNLSAEGFTLLGAIINTSYLINKFYSGKRITIEYTDLEKEPFSENVHPDCEYKVKLTVSFKAPKYLAKEENADKLKETIIDNINEGNADITSLKTKEV